MNVNDLYKRLKTIKDEGFGESLVVIPEFTPHGDKTCPECGETVFDRDGEYAPQKLYTQRRNDSVQVVLE